MRPDERMNQLQRRVVNHALADRMLKVSRGEPISVIRGWPKDGKTFHFLEPDLSGVDWHHEMQRLWWA
ncbi:Uncharacterised protein [Mycobacteroides abscessus subsp. abscessus]|nr:Uncharacterised protein [Mycobacteroides abscessus subsp. abscessus]